MTSPSPMKVVLVLLLGVILLLANLLGSIGWLAPYGAGLVTSWLLLASLGVMYGVFLLLMRHVITPLTVTVRANALHLHWHRAGKDGGLPPDFIL